LGIIASNVKKLSRLLSNLNDDLPPTSKGQPEARAYERYSLDDEDGIIRIENAQGKCSEWRIDNLSYSGFGARVISPEVPPQSINDKFELALSIMGQSHPFSASKIHSKIRDGRLVFLGAQFHHQQPETLMFLRKFLEPIRWGNSLSSIAPEHRHERYKGSDWECLRGDGPTDLTYLCQAAPSSKGNEFPDHALLKSALLTFPSGGNYTEIKWAHGILTMHISSSSKNLQSFQEGNAMEPMSHCDPEQLRTSLCILLGLPKITYNHLSPLVREIRRLIQLESIQDYNDSPVNL